MNYEKLDKLEKYYESKFTGSLFKVSENIRSAAFVEEITIDNEKIEKENFILEKPKRKISMFDQTCKSCQKVILKNIDFTAFYKHNYCYECAVQRGEM